jgi:hypothetical protein
MNVVTTKLDICIFYIVKENYFESFMLATMSVTEYDNLCHNDMFRLW